MLRFRLSLELNFTSANKPLSCPVSAAHKDPYCPVSGDKAQVAAVHQARADRYAPNRAQGQQADGRGSAGQPKVKVRQREDHRQRDDDEAAERAAAAQGGRGHLLQ